MKHHCLLGPRIEHNRDHYRGLRDDLSRACYRELSPDHSVQSQDWYFTTSAVVVNAALFAFDAPGAVPYFPARKSSP